MNLLGLSDSDVTKSRNKYGKNVLPEPKLKTWIQFLADTFKGKLNLILLALLGVFVVLSFYGFDNITEVVGIGLVLVIISVINMITGLKSQRFADDLRRQNSVHYVNVIRNGQKRRILSSDIVVGDLVALAAGDGIYADGYLIDGQISVDNSALNGESASAPKIAWHKQQPPFEPGTPRQVSGDDYTDESSLFAATMVTAGVGVMRVTNVGVSTENAAGIIMMQDIVPEKTSLQIQLDDLARKISVFGFIGAAVIAVILLGADVWSSGGMSAYLSHGGLAILRDVFVVLTTAFVIIIAAVPEGLPLIISLVMSQNASRMARANILAKNPAKIPEAGNIQLLCTDKTGTLTYGNMMVSDVFCGDGRVLDMTRGPAKLRHLFQTAIVATNGAEYIGHKIRGGNSTDRALLALVSPTQYSEILGGLNIKNKLPFDSAYKFTAATVGRNMTFYTGAPERILDRVTSYTDGTGKEKPVSRRALDNVLTSAARDAKRVLAIGYSRGARPTTVGQLPTDLVLVALVTIHDGIRPEATHAVSQIKRAGVQVMMITGDNLETATAVARQTGIVSGDNDVCINAAELEKKSDAALMRLLPKLRVVARATPTTKLRIVKISQKLHLCCGMCGDGTNDAPALKKADVGYAMGNGTDVAKDAADIIITDSNFVSVVQSVLLGRTFMHNITMFLRFQLPINFTLVLLSLVFPLVWAIPALVASQILIVNILMDSLNSLAFGGEPEKPEYFDVPPVPKGTSMLTPSIKREIAGYTIVFLGLFAGLILIQRTGLFTSDQQMTARFVLLVWAAMLNGFNIRTDSVNPFCGLGKNIRFVYIAALVLVGVFVLAQYDGVVFNTVPLNATQWATLLSLAFLVIPIGIFGKLLFANRKK